MRHFTAVGIILENDQNELLLLLRDDKPTIPYPNHWSLVGGAREEDETPETTAHREMLEEIGADTELTLWKYYEKQYPNTIVDQYLYVGKLDLPITSLTLGEGQDMRFFNSDALENIPIGFEFKPLLLEYLKDGQSR